MRLSAFSPTDPEPVRPSEDVPFSAPSSSRRIASSSLLDLGGARFTSGAGLVEACRAATERRWLVAVPAELSASRGEVRRIVDEAVECALASRGALPPQVSLDADPRATVRDQMFRIQALGAAGLLVCFPPLRHAVDEDGVLVDVDATFVCAWLRAAADRDVHILLHESDRGLTITAPRPLEAVVAEVRPFGHDDDDAVPDPIVVGPAVAEGVARWEDGAETSADLGRPLESNFPAAIESVEIAPETLAIAPDDALEEIPELEVPVVAVAGDDPFEFPSIELPPPTVVAASDEEEGDLAGDAPDFVEAAKEVLGDVADAMEEAIEVLQEEAGPEIEPSDELEAVDTPTMEAAPEAEMNAAGEEPMTFGLASVLESLEDEKEIPIPLVPPKAMPNDVRRPRPALRTMPPAPSPAVATQVRTPAASIVTSAEWRALAMELDAARGPKPVRVIEKLYRSRYLPLLGALHRGELDGAVAGVVHAWRDSFAQSYVDSFSAMRVTGKRPSMVFDAPDIATRIARLNGARSVKLLLVDSLSFDVAERLSGRMRDRLNGRAVCVEKTMLWSALPTQTPTQLSLLSRGAEGLREPSPESGAELDVARGRAVSTIRRIRIGHRELMKLDVLEARLRTAGPAYDERMESLAEEAYAIIERFVTTLAPRTLLLVFGDHGFRIPEGGGSYATGPAEQGGASPEEVLVSAHAWLTGGVH